MKLSFHGADQDVTGSCHLLECTNKRILIDCGLFQGSRELSDDNADEFGFDPKSIDFVLLTHAHLDHCGRLPLLVKRGFTGEIITTSATRELARVVLLDAAHLQEEEALRNTRRRSRRNNHGNGNQENAALYTILDAMRTFDYFGRNANYNQRIDLAPGLSVTYYDAGHILGSASLRVEHTDNGATKSIVFSGDLGNSGRPLLRDPVPPPHADAVVMETTYGDRLHRSLKDSVTELYSAINDTFQRGGNVIIPTFALERAQEILFYLREGVEQNKLPGSIQVFLDSPMAISATEIFLHHPECFDEQTMALLKSGHDPLTLHGLHMSREASDSMSLNRIAGGAVIMAGAGMCTGGRIRHHIKHNIWRADSSMVFVGYAAAGTLARRIIDGAKYIELFGEQIPVRSKIHTINGFSAHADRDELLAWHRVIKPDTTFLVHGDNEVMTSFAKLLPGTIHMPQRDNSFEV
ncbi:MAG TPA: MBL fold metallo-hydrolase [Steroidobacteraceae bacterium]|jgi:metallo-beta-lactamase family protein|nr:MBL fold metallo-hydrolase [Steroidobacteraceae bacterium]